MKAPLNLCALPAADYGAIIAHRDECLEKHNKRLEQAKLWLKLWRRPQIRGHLAKMEDSNPEEAARYRAILNQLTGKN